MKVTRGFAFIFGAMGMIYGFHQRRLRLQEQAAAAQRISQLTSRSVPAAALRQAK
jgi:hypothetical protein